MFTDVEGSRVPLGESRGPSPHRAPADQVVGAGVTHQRPQLAEEGRYGAPARLHGQRGRRFLHSVVSALQRDQPWRRGLVKAAESAVFAARPALLRLPELGLVGTTCESAGEGLRPGPQHQQTERAGWDRLCEGVRWEGRPGFVFHPSHACCFLFYFFTFF